MQHYSKRVKKRGSRKRVGKKHSFTKKKRMNKRYRLNGGAPAPIVPTMSSQYSTTGGQPTGSAATNASNNNQNGANNALGAKSGGGRKKKISNRKNHSRTHKRKKIKQRGGSDWLDALYSYAPPPGFWGPIPQPSIYADTNKLILTAAQISGIGQANAQFDNRVNK